MAADATRHRPLVRAYTPVPLDPRFPSGFAPRWFHFLRALGEHCDLDVVAVRRIFDSGAAPETFRPPLALHGFTLTSLDWEPPPRSRLLRAAAWIRHLATGTWSAPDLVNPPPPQAPDLAIFFLHQLAHLAFRLPANLPCIFVLEEPVIRLEAEHVRGNPPRRLWRWLLYRLRLRAYGRFAARCASRGPVVVISEEEKAWFSRWIPGDRITVISHAIDPAEFNPRVASIDHDAAIFGDLGQHRNYHPAAELITRAQDGPARNLRWLLVGRDPHSSLQRLAGAHVTLTGAVPETQPYYARARVVVVPSRRVTGAKSTVLQAWAMQRPVVTTPAGVRGLPARPGSNVLVADGDDAILAAVQRLLSEPVLAERIAVEGRETVVRHCSLEARARSFAALCLETLGRTGLATP